MNMQKSLNRRDFMKIAGATGLATMTFAGGIPSLALADTRKATANLAVTDLFFYSQPIGRGEFYGADGLGHIDHLSTSSALSKSFAQILSGSFILHGLTEGMLFYDNVQGSGTFYIPDRRGGLALLNHQTGWRKSWTHIEKGHFVENSHFFDDLLFYEGHTGVSEFYRLDGKGHIQLIKQDIWSKNWTKIIPGPFAFNPRGLSGLFFYDRPNGVGAFYGTDGAGGIYLLRRHTGLRTTWTTITTTPFGLLFYDANSGVSEFYRTDGQGGLHLLKHDTWSKGWTHIISSQHFLFGSNVGGLLFYNSNTGASAFYRYANAEGNISLLRRDTWRKGWTRILDNPYNDRAES